MAIRRRRSQPFSISLPATSANLGPAFDAAALAFNLFIKVRAREAEEFSIAAKGRDAEICGQLENHLILNTYREVLNESHRRILPLALEVDNGIPIGKGCGSSAAARLAGIALAVHFGKLPWNDTRIIGEASRREQHPDNAAACWMGGVAVVRMATENEAQVVSLKLKGQWPLLMAIPEEPLSTQGARQVLPNQYSRADAVVNIQNSMLLLAAFTQGRPDLLSAALDDRIHQPYRASLCPLLPALQKLAGKSGVLGAVLSGAGPSVLVFADAKANLQRTKKAIADHLRQEGLRAELIAAEISSRRADHARTKRR
jgi:homoserine kinase